MKYFLTFLCLLAVPARAGIPYVLNKGGTATNLTSIGVQTADKIVATNFTGNAAGLTNVQDPNVALLSRAVQAFTGGTNSFSGVVGIQTVDPKAPLHVKSSGGFLGEIQTTRTGSGIVLFKFADSVDTAHGYFGFDPSTSGFEVSANGANLLLNSPNFGGGNVGVNTVSPGAALDVTGNVRASTGFTIPAATLPVTAAAAGCQISCDGTNLLIVFKNAGGVLTTNKATLSSYP